MTHGHGRKGMDRCTDACVCPEHGTQLLYNRAHDLHACQDPDCRYGHGLEPVLLDEMIEARQNDWVQKRNLFADVLATLDNCSRERCSD